MKRILPATILGVAAFGYPLVFLAGGMPHFPTSSECIREAKSDRPIEAVFGRYREWAVATTTLKRVLDLGFKGAQIKGDGCGYLLIVVEGIPSLAVGRDLVAEAHTVGLRPRLAQSGP